MYSIWNRLKITDLFEPYNLRQGKAQEIQCMIYYNIYMYMYVPKRQGTPRDVNEESVLYMYSFLSKKLQIPRQPFRSPLYVVISFDLKSGVGFR